MKSENQITQELLERNNVAEIKNAFCIMYTKTDYTVESHSGQFVDIAVNGDTLLELVSETAKDFTKDIAVRCLGNQSEPSEKQAWCIAYQIHNNIETYKLAMIEYNEICLKDLAEIKYQII